MIGKLRSAKIVLAEPLRLDHRPHGAVKDQDPLGEQPLEEFRNRRLGDNSHHSTVAEYRQIRNV